MWRVSAIASASLIERVSVAMTVVLLIKFVAVAQPQTSRTASPRAKAMPAISAAPVISSAITINCPMGDVCVVPYLTVCWI